MNAPTTLPVTLHPEQRLKLPQVLALCGIGKTKLYAELRDGAFPAPERHGVRCSRWRAGDVLDHLQRKREAA